MSFNLSNRILRTVRSSAYSRSTLSQPNTPYASILRLNKSIHTASVLRAEQRENKSSDQQGGKGSGQLIVRFATPSESIVSDKPAYMVTVPASTGVMGILADHAPTIAQLKPGIVQVHTNDINDITHRYFVSGGFAFVKDDSSTAIAAVEAVKVDDLDLAAAKKGIEDSIAAQQRTQDEKQKAEAQIQQEVYEAIVNAIEGR